MKICIWGNIAGALNGKTDGGGELQIALLSRALAECGHEVVIIDYQTTEDFITPEGIKVLRIKGWNNGIRIIRTITHRLPKLYRSLKNQKADIYYSRIRDFRHFLAFWAARKVKGRFVLHMASDLDAMNFFNRLKKDYVSHSGNLYFFFNAVFIELIYPFLFRKADLVLTQHEGQKSILLKRKIKSVIFFNLFDLKEIHVSSDDNREDFVYVGWLDKQKGFTDFFKIVERAPYHTFKVIGPPRDKTGEIYYEKLKSFQNVSLLGALSHSDTMRQIANSKALISTSPMEGFPNIFIEAWACGIPVISLYVDPGSVIEKEGLGVIANGNLEKMLEALDNIKNTCDFAKKAKSYVEHNHALNAEKIAEINKLFCDLHQSSAAKKAPTI